MLPVRAILFAVLDILGIPIIQKHLTHFASLSDLVMCETASSPKNTHLLGVQVPEFSHSSFELVGKEISTGHPHLTDICSPACFFDTLHVISCSLPVPPAWLDFLSGTHKKVERSKWVCWLWGGFGFAQVPEAVVQILTVNSSRGEAVCQNSQLCILGCYTATR